MADRITIREMFDAHVHVRQGIMLKTVLPYTTRQCFGAVIMPNTNPIISTPERALAYRDEIMESAPDGFTPVMTGYLTEDMDPKLVERGFQMGAWKALKFYPKSAKHGAGTTNAHSGVTELRRCAHIFSVMEEIGMPLLLHGERLDEVHNDEETDHYDREALFIKHDLPWLLDGFPDLPIVLEHISTKEAADLMKRFGKENRLCATITGHHLALDRRDALRNGTTSMLGCKPIIKREIHKLALQGLVSHGLPFIFAGTDSAPHPRDSKENACGCADGVFTAHCAVELYAQIFDNVNALPMLENFLSINGPRFYGIQPSEKKLELVKENWQQGKMIIKAHEHPDDPDYPIVYPFGYHPDAEKRWQFTWNTA